jgi:hyperosmotically inducible periplasmic protein
MKLLITLFLGAAIGVAAYVYFKQGNTKIDFDQAGERISESAGELRDTLNQQVTNIDTEQIKKELAETGQVVRKKAQEAGAKIADASADARITGAIKSKYALESDLSALTISVNTTKGMVTLSGRVSSHENIKKAMRLALETDGVTEVVSTLQAK